MSDQQKTGDQLRRAWLRRGWNKPADNAQPLIDAVTAVMDMLENLPCGGIGKDGATMDELNEAAERRQYLDNDSTADIGQRAWRTLDAALTAHTFTANTAATAETAHTHTATASAGVDPYPNKGQGAERSTTHEGGQETERGRPHLEPAYETMRSLEACDTPNLVRPETADKTPYALLGWEALDGWAVRNDPTWRYWSRLMADTRLDNADTLRLLCSALLEDKHRLQARLVNEAGHCARAREL